MAKMLRCNWLLTTPGVSAEEKLLMAELTISMLLLIGGEGAGIEVNALGLAQEEVDVARLVLQGMKDGRDRLRSGVFRAHGRKREVGGSGLPDIDDSVEFSGAFDYSSGLFRFDSEDVILFAGGDYAGKPVEESEKTVDDLASLRHAPTRVSARYIDTPDASFHWHSHFGPTVYRRDPGVKPGGTETVFDVRCLGMIYRGDMRNRFLTFPRLCEILAEADVIHATEETDSLVRIDWAYGPLGVLKRSVWFDKERGYSPIRLEGRSGDLSISPEQTSEATWTQISGVWVPRTFVMQTWSSSGSFRSKLEFAIEWESVNSPVSLGDKRFSAEGLELPPYAEIVSTELGQMPIRLGHVGEAPFAPLSRRRLGWGRLLAIAISLVLLVAAIGTVILRRHMATRRN